MKPKINGLFNAIANYQIEMARANYSVTACTNAISNLKEDFKKLGIYDMFDWESD